MLTRTIYEALPLGYITLGSSSIILLEQNIALISATILFWLGARIYNLRSKNRRTDKERRRKPGVLPEFFYDFMPFTFLFLALFFFKVDLSSAIVMAIILMSYSLYILARRKAYRRHKTPKQALA
ncbi:hypothetical protein [Shewanella gelidii]|uniref:Amino acid permease n=1 Tax=Shewanella gelidii TaxID=1642821 RepID=A0A917JIP1_9GAMM|nr:hypothetical protein [Shewanella gelidii]MCL1096641.1 hypothetical protein [Shewanella gelidii]GGI69094.1 hypothetical protein GCM10009332_02760 [Shewanella gelidii]